MHTLRNTLLILFAIIIDGTQALISAALFAIGAFPGTFAGGATGAAAGGYVAGSVGAAIGGFLGGLVGTPLDVFAPTTLPLAIVMGFVINFCIDVTFGTLLSMWLLTQGMYYPKYAIGGWVAELIPGLNDMPAWTVSTVLAVIRKNAEENASEGTSASIFTQMIGGGTLLGAGVAAITAINQKNVRTAEQTGVFAKEQQDQQTDAGRARVSIELKNIDGIRSTRPDTTPLNAAQAVRSKLSRYAA